MDILSGVIAALAGYLIGSISFTRIVMRLTDPGKPLETMVIQVPDSDEVFEVGAASASVAGMSRGSRTGCMIAFLDIAKAFLAVLATRLLFPEQYLYLVVAVTVTIGHIWPLYYRFKGGRGISTIYGGLLAVDPLAGPVASLIGLVFGLLVARDFTVAYLSGVVLVLPWLWIRTGGNAYFIAYAIAINIVHAAGMLPEYKQYIKFKRQGKVPDLQEVMGHFPMGRGLTKIANFLKIDLRS